MYIWHPVLQGGGQPTRVSEEWWAEGGQGAPPNGSHTMTGKNNPRFVQHHAESLPRATKVLPELNCFDGGMLRTAVKPPSSPSRQEPG